MNLRRWPLLRRYNDLRFLIFYVTSQCNARCRTCFFWKDLNTGRGPGLSEIEKLAATSPRFRTLLIGGGEPSLRDDLPQIVTIFRRHNHIHDASVPTNGLLPARIEALARQTLTLNRGLLLSFNVSLDGPTATHDRLRGVPGSFDRAVETIHRLAAVRSEEPRLSVVVNTVICAENLSEIVPFARFAWEELPLDGHFFELIRGNPKDLVVEGLPGDALATAYKELVRIQERYLERSTVSMGVVRRVISRVLGTGRLLWQYRAQYRRYVQGQLWTVDCRAGRTIGVVEPNGTLKACELRGAVASLADSDWDLAAAWYGPEMSRETRRIAADRCDCTHVCFVQSSRDHSLRATLVEVPWLWLRYRRNRAWL